MRIFLFFVLPLLLLQHGERFTRIASISVKAEQMVTDNLGNVFVINGNELKKYNSTGDLVNTFSEKRFGNITSVDALNALRILVFYTDFASLIFLDNRLSPIGNPIHLNDMGLLNPESACMSNDNSIWIFERSTFQLVRFDAAFHPVIDGNDLRQLFRRDIHPVQMVESGNVLFLNDPDTGIMIFDRFATYIKTVPIKSISDFQPDGSNIIYLKNASRSLNEAKANLKDSVKMYNFLTLEESGFIAPVHNPESIRTGGNKLFVRTPDSVEIFSVGK